MDLLTLWIRKADGRAYVARKHGRRSVGIELNPAYCELAAKRMQQQSLFAETAHEVLDVPS